MQITTKINPTCIETRYIQSFCQVAYIPYLTFLLDVQTTLWKSHLIYSKKRKQVMPYIAKVRLKCELR
jgi:hypothetical protein